MLVAVEGESSLLVLNIDQGSVIFRVDNPTGSLALNLIQPILESPCLFIMKDTKGLSIFDSRNYSIKKLRDSEHLVNTFKSLLTQFKDPEDNCIYVLDSVFTSDKQRSVHRFRLEAEDVEVIEEV